MQIELSIIIPTLNEVESIQSTLACLEQVPLSMKHEVIVVDDDSNDGTWQAIRKLSENHEHLRLIRRVHRKGLSKAVVEGFLAAKGRKLLVTDADQQHELGIIPEMYEASKTQDLVIGSRYLDQSSIKGWSSHRQKLSHYGTQLACCLLNKKVSDPLSGFFIIDASVLHEIAYNLRSNGFKLLFEILMKFPDLKLQEIPYEFKARNFGKSKLRGAVLWDFIETLLTKSVVEHWNLVFLKSIFAGLSGVVVNLVLFFLLRNVGLSFFYSLVFSVHLALVWNFMMKSYVCVTKSNLSRLIHYYWANLFGTLAILTSGYLISQLHYQEWTTVTISLLLGSGWNFFGNQIFTWENE